MGYIGIQFSEGARDAYLDGKKPLSSWTKEEIVSAFSEDLAPLVKKLTLQELKRYFLACTEWHHTGSYYNKTDFYCLDEESVEKLTAERISEIIARRPKKEKKAKSQPLFVTAKIKYTEWVGNSRRYMRPVERIEVVYFMSNDKMVSIGSGCIKKRLSSVKILEQIVQKTKFADAKRLK